jgi:hypothetical protein
MGGGTGSSPAITLILVVFLIGLHICGEQKEIIMKKMLSVKARVRNCGEFFLFSIFSSTFETIRTIGTSVAAAMIFPPSPIAAMANYTPAKAGV